MKISNLKVKNYILTALEEAGFRDLTEVQEAVIPQAISGRDLIVQSQTGSGKTHSFLIPIFDRLDESVDQVQAVITAPSRELADQLYQLAQTISDQSDQPIRVAKYIGGTDKQRQINALGTSKQPQIVIGTPGRIFDLMEENALWVQTARMMVVDEADMTLDLGFLSLVDDIASRMPEDLQMMAFSATVPQELQVFLAKYMQAPFFIQIKPKQVISEYIHNYLINTKGRSREELTYEILTLGQPYLALVFCNTKAYADQMANFLKEKGLKVATLHGDIPSRERKRLMRQIQHLDFQYVVATDLAARGIDIPGISHVVNTELPQDLEYFVHRVGRTGRNGLEGEAFTFITPDDDQAVSELESWGIDFETVELRQGQLRAVKHRDERKNRQDTVNVKEDPKVRAMINRNKKRKVKPGYKRKLNWKIKEHRQEKARQEGRKARRSHKKS